MESRKQSNLIFRRDDMASLVPYDINAQNSEREIPFEVQSRDLPSTRLLGKGLAGIGYETTWKGARYARKDFVGVRKDTFLKEAPLLVSLDHKYIVKTYGWTIDKRSCSLVLEYMDDDLLSLLQRRNKSNKILGEQSSTPTPTPPFDILEALDMMLQNSLGLNYLHARAIAHGDLKTKNILVSRVKYGDLNSKVVKVTDYGLVQTKRKSKFIVSRQVRKLDMVRWKAPECWSTQLMRQSNNEDGTSSESESESTPSPASGVSFTPPVDNYAADVYSFAVICSQLLTGTTPYPHMNWKELGHKILDGLRPNLPNTCDPKLRNLLVSCWGGDPAERPSFAIICSELTSIQLSVATAFGKQLQEVAKLKLLNTPLSGNGGGKGDHPVGTDQAREIVRQAAMAVTTPEQPKVALKKGTVWYRECQKNHAASIGGHAIDGCGEFMPSGDDGFVDAFWCAACDCHRNFHRREVEGEVVCDGKKPKLGTLVPFNSKNKLPLSSTPQSAAATTTSTPVPLSTPHLGQEAPLTITAFSAGSGSSIDSDESDAGQGNSGMMMSIRSPSAIKTRVRTIFTAEQKDQMCAFAEKVGWRIQKHDEGAVQEFCSTVGVKRHVLKVWMHNNKLTMGKKP